MFAIIKAFFAKLYELLPDSPFQALIADNAGILSDMLGWINWFVPFDVCFKITEVWAAAIAAWQLFAIVRKIVFDFIIAKLLS